MDRGIIIKSAIKNLQSLIVQGQKQQKSDLASTTDKLENSGSKIALVKKQKNIRHRVTSLLPNIEANYIYELFGFIGVNEKAIENQNFGESFISTHFFGKVIRKVQVSQNAVIIEFVSSELIQNLLPMQYLIQRYKSKGNSHYFEIAENIRELYQIFKQLKQQSSTVNLKHISFNKTLESLGNDMFIFTNGVSKLAISKSLLTYLEYDVQEFAVEAIKYHSIFTEFFSAKQYINVVKHLINTIKYRVQFNKGLISLEQFKELSTMSITDFIYSKSGVKTYCNSTIFVLNVEYLCHKVDRILYRSNQIALAIENYSEQHKQIKEEKSKIQQKEYQTLKRIKQLPRHLLNQNSSRIVSYKTIETEMQQEISDWKDDNPQKTDNQFPKSH